MFSLLLKEINEFIHSLIAYLVMGVFLVSIGLLMWIFPESSILDYGYASMETLFSLGPYVFIFLASAITMKSFADEKKNGTLEILYTLPLKEIEIIAGKYIACLLLILFSIIPTIIYYISIYKLGYPEGNLDSAGIFSSYLGLILLCSTFSSLGVLSSAITGNSLSSFILSTFLCFILYTGFESISQLEILLNSSYYIQQIGILSHYTSLSRGLIEFNDIIYFISLDSFFLYITYLVIKIQKE